MIGRNATAGLALLCALLFSAFAAQSAFAQVGTNATNTTAVTCVENGGQKDFSDAHCDTFVGAEKGKFGHVAIKAGESTAVEVTNAKTKGGTTESTPAKLNTTHLGVQVEVTCTVVKSSNSSLLNVEKEGKHTVEGTVKVEFTKCTVAKPANCTVKEPIETIALAKGVEGLKFGAETKAMGLEFTQDEGKNFAELTFEGEKCTFKAKTFPVTGSAIATGAPNPGQATKHSGATANYETGNEMDTLKFSTSNADFTGSFTTNMSGGGNPIALTTAT